MAAAPAEGRLGGTDVDRIERPSITTETAIFDSTPKWALPYAIAHVPPLAPWIDPGDIASRFAMVDGIRAVVGIEGPVHVDVLDQRLRQAWSIGRIGRNIRDNIDAAMGLAGVIRDGEFARMNGAVPAIRMPSQGCARTVRQVHDDELAQALERFVRDAGGITADDLTGAVARIYGWNRRGAEIVSRMEALIDSLVSTRRLQRQAGGLSAGE